MKLTGKAKEEFEKWYDKMLIQFKKDNPKKLSWMLLARYFDLPESMQFGVYQDFADSVGIEINIKKKIGGLFLIQINYNGKRHHYLGVKNKHFTRPEARTAAIEKFNEIFNNTN